MKIPHKVHILGQDFEIVTIKDKKGRDFVGRCFVNANKIELLDCLPDDKRAQTYIHEVLHAITINLNMHKRIKHSDIDTLSVAIYQWLKDNHL